jgi:tetratricopeptide (TPR) repeat protein
MLARLERFASAWREGVARMREDRSTEAIAALEQADQAERALAAGRDGPLGREVRRALSGLHTRAAQAHTSDEEVGAAAAHLRAALAQDPGNEEARDQLGRLAARANEAYLSGYVAKDTDPDSARRRFRLVVAALPANDETAIKARRWLDRLDGKAGAEDPPPP